MLKMPDECLGNPALTLAYERALENFMDHMVVVMDSNSEVFIDKDLLADTTKLRISFRCDPVYSEYSISNHHYSLCTWLDSSSLTEGAGSSIQHWPRLLSTVLPSTP